jgi:hypothetical protein
LDFCDVEQWRNEVMAAVDMLGGATSLHGSLALNVLGWEIGLRRWAIVYRYRHRYTASQAKLIEVLERLEGFDYRRQSGASSVEAVKRFRAVRMQLRRHYADPHEYRRAELAEIAAWLAGHAVSLRL